LLVDGGTKIVWIKKLLHEFQILAKGFIFLLGDNHRSIHLMKNLVYHIYALVQEEIEVCNTWGMYYMFFSFQKQFFA
jgi:hypothetical protein